MTTEDISIDDEDFPEIATVAEEAVEEDEEPAFFEVAAKEESAASPLAEAEPESEPKAEGKPVILPGVFDDLDEAFTDIGEPAAEEKPVVPVKARGAGKGQAEMSFDGGPRGRFEGASPSLFEGEDLDVPAFLRKKR